jgi:hypothetical protein
MFYSMNLKCDFLLTFKIGGSILIWIQIVFFLIINLLVLKGGFVPTIQPSGKSNLIKKLFS